MEPPLLSVDRSRAQGDRTSRLDRGAAADDEHDDDDDEDDDDDGYEDDDGDDNDGDDFGDPNRVQGVRPED